METYGGSSMLELEISHCEVVHRRSQFLLFQVPWYTNTLHGPNITKKGNLGPSSYHLVTGAGRQRPLEPGGFLTSVLYYFLY